MTNLLTCFHTLADPDILSENEWIEGCEAGAMDFSYIRRTVNSFDESALELACRFRDAGEENKTSLTAVTIGDKTNETALRTLAALGFARSVRIDAETDELTSESAADILTGWIKEQASETDDPCPFDLIITGQSSGDWNQAKIPMLVAGQLGIRCFTNVTAFAPADDIGAVITWLTDDAACTAYVPFPAVLSVGDVSGAFLRVPTLRQRMDSKKQETETLTADPDAGSGGCVRFLDMEAVTERREAVFIDGVDADAAADSMLVHFTGWMKE